MSPTLRLIPLPTPRPYQLDTVPRLTSTVVLVLHTSAEVLLIHTPPLYPHPQHLMDTLLHAVPRLASVAVLIAFHLVLFGAINTNLFAGAMRYR